MWFCLILAQPAPFIVLTEKAIITSEKVYFPVHTDTQKNHFNLPDSVSLFASASFLLRVDMWDL